MLCKSAGLWKAALTLKTGEVLGGLGSNREKGLNSDMPEAFELIGIATIAQRTSGRFSAEVGRWPAWQNNSPKSPFVNLSY